MAPFGNHGYLDETYCSKHRQPECRTVSDTLARIGDKWSVLVVVYLGDGPLRFSELRRRIDGISQKMLTVTVRGLERDGYLTRTVTPSIPPRVDYELTDLGRELLGADPRARGLRPAQPAPHRRRPGSVRRQPRRRRLSGRPARYWLIAATEPPRLTALVATCSTRLQAANGASVM